MTLKEKYEESKRWYAENYGDLEKCWQWNDEGKVYAIGEYLSSWEMTEEDWEFARKEGIEDEVKYEIDHLHDDED